LRLEKTSNDCIRPFSTSLDWARLPAIHGMRVFPVTPMVAGVKLSKILLFAVFF